MTLEAHAQSRFDRASPLGHQVLDDGRVQPLLVVGEVAPGEEQVDRRAARAKTPGDARAQVVVGVRRQLEVRDVVLFGSPHVVHVGPRAVARELEGHADPVGRNERQVVVAGDVDLRRHHVEESPEVERSGGPLGDGNAAFHVEARERRVGLGVPAHVEAVLLLTRRGLVVAAVPVSLRVIWKTRPVNGNRLFVSAALVGLGLLLLAAFIEAVSPYEEPITVAGGALLGSAHLWHWVRKCGGVASTASRSNPMNLDGRRRA